MSDEKIIGKGTWIDKLAAELIEREKKLGRNLDLIRVESGLGASGIPHIGSLGDAVRAYGVKLALENQGYKSELIAYSDDLDGLRKPSDKAHRDEVGKNSCIVREIHVYGKSLKLGEKGDGKIQHSGLGKNLMKEAEKISKEELDAKNILVISAIGTREYYQKLGYSLYGPYMSKKLN